MVEAVNAFIASQLASEEELKEAKATFRALDRNGDGQLTKAELLEGYTRVFGSEQDCEVDRVLSEVSASNSGVLDYTQFLAATLDSLKVVTEQNLVTAFQLFDKNGDGRISVQELQEVLGVADKKLWSRVVQEFDSNHDGFIDFEEFKRIFLQNPA